MRLNERTVLLGSKVVLVPYKQKYVEQYWGWMQDEALLLATASEKLTLAEEKENCESWHVDEKKLTFLIMEKDELIGDCNIFFLNDDEAEVEVMIVPVACRRKGLAQEAVTMLMSYAQSKKKIARFLAKIGNENEASFNLFQKKLGFSFVENIKAFNQSEFEMLTETFRPAHYAECLLEEDWDGNKVLGETGIQVQEFALGDSKVTLMYFGRKSILVFCGMKNFGNFSVAAPAAFPGGDRAASNLIGDSQRANGIASRLAAKTKRLVFVSWPFGDDDNLDDNLDISIEAALAKRIPPLGYLPHPSTTFFHSQDEFDSFGSLKASLAA